MRIISGSRRGRKIVPPANLTARPTTDFAKESLFNILNNITDLTDTTALDLFSGTGSISYELASRGVTHVTAIEENKMHVDFIKRMIAQLGFDDCISVVKTDVFKYLASCYAKYDLVFADPPYDLEKLELIPDLVLSRNMLKEGGVLVLEHPSTYDFSQSPHFFDHRHYGSVNFSFFH